MEGADAGDDAAALDAGAGETSPAPLAGSLALDAQEAPDDVAPAAAGGEGGSRGRAPPGTSGANRVVVCQVQGCAATQLRPYNIRNRLCNDHMRAESLDIDGEARRFCQKCNRLHALTAFSGGKRTCARLLADHNARRRATYAARRARDASAEPPALRAGAAGGEEQTAQMHLLQQSLQQSLAAMPGAAAMVRANDAAMLQAAVWNALCSSAGAAGGAGAAGAAAALAAAAAAQQQQPARPTATAWPPGLEWLAQLQDPAALAALAAGQAQAGQTGQVALPPALLATLLAAPPAALAAAAQPQQPQQQPQPPRKT